MNQRRRRQGIVALAMLLGMNFGTFERVEGDTRDLTTHYGAILEAGHTTDAVNVSPVTAGQRQRGKHIKGFDHCSHAHGCSVRASSLGILAESVVPESSPRVPVVLPPDAPPARLYHPPKA